MPSIKEMGSLSIDSTSQFIENIRQKSSLAIKAEINGNTEVMNNVIPTNIMIKAPGITNRLEIIKYVGN